MFALGLIIAATTLQTSPAPALWAPAARAQTAAAMAIQGPRRALPGTAAALATVESRYSDTPPEPLQQTDPADSMYRRARQALNRASYHDAATLFRDIRSRYPKSAYTPDAYYWEAYAQYRRGGQDALRSAAGLLDEQRQRYPDASTRKTGDARSLEARVQGELARRGDEGAAAVLARDASRAATAPPAPPSPPAAVVAPAPRAAPAALARVRERPQDDACRDSEDDVQTAALNALMQMDSERAIPILKKVLARRDDASLCLRRKAVFLVSQHEDAGTEEILLSTARTDPDAEVRGQAVFWLSQVDSPRATAALDSIATGSKDPEIQEKAIFALSQQESPEARRALRRFAERSDISDELRGKAVFWLGQSDDPENAAFLRTLFGRVKDEELKERILFSIGQNDEAGSSKFLAEVARNQAESMETRKKAIFWLGQREETTGADLASIYGTFADREIKEQLLFVLSQKDEKAATDKLIDIAKREPDKELRKKAIFWLGQSNDPRVAEILTELLEKP